MTGAISNPLSLQDNVNRRKVLKGCLAGFVGIGSMHFGSEVGAQERKKRSGLLMRPAEIDALAMRCKLVLELDGELRIEEPDPNKSEGERTAKVKGKSTFEFSELTAFSSDEPVAAARSYSVAESSNWIEGREHNIDLRKTCKNTRLLAHRGTWQEFCEAEQLSLREVELLHLPVNTNYLDFFLPDEPAKPEESWKVSEKAAKAIFNLDAVWKSTVVAQITKVEKGVATIEFEGELDATANSVETRLELKGNLQARLGSKSAFVSWLGLAIKEDRNISNTEPGFAITARVRLIREEIQAGTSSSVAALRQLAKSQAISEETDGDDLGRWLAKMESPQGGYEMLIDRNWNVFIDSGEEAVLRMIENDNVIAQCNVGQLPKLEDGKQLTIEGMQADIRSSLGDAFGEFLQSSEKLTDSKLRLIKCVVMGERDDVPIQWIYNHLSDDKGRRIAVVYTMGGNVVDRFAAADEQMVSSFRFRERQTTETDGKVEPQKTELTTRPKNSAVR